MAGAKRFTKRFIRKQNGAATEEAKMQKIKLQILEFGRSTKTPPQRPEYQIVTLINEREAVLSWEQIKRSAKF